MRRRGPRSNVDFELMIRAIAHVKGHRRYATTKRMYLSLSADTQNAIYRAVCVQIEMAKLRLRHARVSIR